MMEATVRMYRQGLGDCFLLLFKNKASSFSILIDCGVIVGTEGARSKMKNIVENIKKTVNNHLNLLIVTHEHFDHISGFIQAQEEFQDPDFKIDKVWFAWTENPANPLANKLQKERERKIQLLKKAFQLSENRGVKIEEAKEVLRFFGEVFDSKSLCTTKRAIDFIRTNLGDVIEYRHPNDKPIQFKEFDSIRVFVLGPPEDEKLIKRSNPSSEKEVYEIAYNNTLEESFANAVGHALLRYSNNDEEKEIFYNQSDPCSPFDSYYEVKRKEAEENEFFKYNYGTSADPNNPNRWREIGNDWLSAAGELALKLDSHTNNTSLAIAIELIESGKVLLFPGDAQVGNWLSWHNYSWKIKANGGGKSEVSATDLLENTVLYKAAHHLSHNGTLKDKGLEMMNHPELVVMIPVDEKMAVSKKWSKIPFLPLLERLKIKTKGRVIRLDTGIPKQKPSDLSRSEWLTFQKACANSTDEYIEYTING